MIKGVGPKTAAKLVATFGTQCLEIIEKEPDKLTTCEGIGAHRAERIIKGWQEQRAIQEVMVFLQGHGVSSAYAVKIFKNLGEKAVETVSANPYILAYEIRGIGFKTADKIASEFGITGEDPRRLNAGILFVLSTAHEEGNLFLTCEQLLKKSREILVIERDEPLETAIKAQVESRRLTLFPWEGQELFYLPFAFRAEHGSVEALKPFLAPPRPLNRDRLLRALEKAVAECGVTLSDIQQVAVERSLQERILVITGGPGTGKTTTLRAVVKAHQNDGRQLLLASPTGRAAKRLAEVTGEPAVTLHRLLEFSPRDNSFQRNAQKPLACRTLVVDEASMLDMDLFYGLIRALPPSGTIILVGDVDQLPSVGAGLVLKSLIQSGVVPTVRLDRIFRQAESSMIITNAHRVNRGEMPILVKPDGKTVTDCYFLEGEEAEPTLALLKNVVGTSLPKKFSYDPIRDIQVLSPMNRGALGAGNLNIVLQEALNPPTPEKAEIKNMHRIFRVGDKVIQTRNNYDLEVFNGDIGFIARIEPEDQEIVVEFPEGEKVYQPADYLDLSHAYCVTVHKAQGSEYPAVVLIVSTQHYALLQRNLIYTGLTRAKKTLVFLGTKKALGIGVRNDKVRERNTLLGDLLNKLKVGEAPPS
jgi:exodeoxyribonuclease V alpha subunit